MSLEALGIIKVGPDVVPEGLHLIAAVTGFGDTASTVTQFSDYVFDTLETTPVVEFRHDELLDYRARRPTIYFDQDHLTGYEPPRLGVYLVKDDIGRPFLFLTGYEPDFKWDGFTQAVLDVVDRFRVSQVTWIHSIPMPTPHTRPIGVTVSGSRSDLIGSHSVWRPHTQLPSMIMHLVEYRLHQRGDEVVGFVLLVPHYLGDTEYPEAAIKAFECVTLATGLLFPTDKLREESREFANKLGEQAQENDDLARLVENLEGRYDKYMAENSVRLDSLDDQGPLPSADEIAAELEKFLALRKAAEDGDGVTGFPSS